MLLGDGVGCEGGEQVWQVFYVLEDYVGVDCMQGFWCVVVWVVFVEVEYCGVGGYVCSCVGDGVFDYCVVCGVYVQCCSGCQIYIWMWFGVGQVLVIEYIGFEYIEQFDFVQLQFYFDQVGIGCVGNVVIGCCGDCMYGFGCFLDCFEVLFQCMIVLLVEFFQLFFCEWFVGVFCDQFGQMGYGLVEEDFVGLSWGQWLVVCGQYF